LGTRVRCDSHTVPIFNKIAKMFKEGGRTGLIRTILTYQHPNLSVNLHFIYTNYI